MLHLNEVIARRWIKKHLNPGDKMFKKEKATTLFHPLFHPLCVVFLVHIGWRHKYRHKLTLTPKSLWTFSLFFPFNITITPTHILLKSIHEWISLGIWYIHGIYKIVEKYARNQICLYFKHEWKGGGGDTKVALATPGWRRCVSLTGKKKQNINRTVYLQSMPQPAGSGPLGLLNPSSNKTQQ